MLKILTVPNPVLNKPSLPTVLVDSRIKKLVKEMEKTLEAQVDPVGVGLAAPQIGENIRLFIMKPMPGAAKITVCINPTISSTPGVATGAPRVTKKNKLEGCLSIPHIWSAIVRKPSVKLEYQDLSGKIITKLFRGFEAVIVQHEMDHLEGVLFTQRAVEQAIPVYEERGKKLEKVTI